MMRRRAQGISSSRSELGRRLVHLPTPEIGRRIHFPPAALRRATLVVLPLVGGCEGVQSAFSAFGTEAESIRSLAIVMFVSAAVITACVLALAVHAVRSGPLDPARGMRVILWLGAVFPTLVLTALLVTSLPTMRTMPTAEGDLTIAIGGEQFWWRVRYEAPDGEAVETANEIRLPVGRTVAFALESPDVIHSFWIPGLAGKVDMIPGRTNDLVVRATAAVVHRGVCAEFCGLSHAHMAFDVIAMEPGAFDAWLSTAAAPAAAVDAPGRRLFDEYGCPGCHVVRGHFEGGPIGPDLTHFGSRQSFGAGSFAPTVETIAAFIVNPSRLKPGALMPAFPHMSAEDAAAIGAYLAELE